MSSTDPISDDIGARAHHVGYVVQSISRTAKSMAFGLRARWDERIIHDPSQQVNVAFLSPFGDTLQIELVEPAGERSPVSGFLRRGGGLHHVAYVVPRLPLAIQSLRDSGALLVSGPTPAVAFDNRDIAWLYTSTRLLVELIEQ